MRKSSPLSSSASTCFSTFFSADLRWPRSDLKKKCFFEPRTLPGWTTLRTLIIFYFTSKDNTTIAENEPTGSADLFSTTWKPLTLESCILRQKKPDYALHRAPSFKDVASFLFLFQKITFLGRKHTLVAPKGRAVALRSEKVAFR